MTNKQIFILNGAPRAGKDTFAKLLNKLIPTKHISSITPVKNAAISLGWNGDKTDKARNFLCELKKFVNSQGDYIWNYLDIEVEKFQESSGTILLIDICEPEEIEKAVERYNAKTIKITRPNECSFNYAPSTADRDVCNYEYDYDIGNSGNWDDFKQIVRDFYIKSVQPLLLPLAGKVIAVDFDNTIARTKYPEILEPIDETIEFLKTAKELGAKIVLWTCREDKVLQDAIRWCILHYVPIDYINENVPERIKLFGNDSRKIGADLYIDDKSVGHIQNSDHLLIWLKNQDTFVKKLIIRR